MKISQLIAMLAKIEKETGDVKVQVIDYHNIIRDLDADAVIIHNNTPYICPAGVFED